MKSKTFRTSHIVRSLWVWSAALVGSWAVFLVAGFRFGFLRTAAWVACALPLVWAIRWALDVKHRSDLELSRRAREADIARRRFINGHQATNGKRGTAA